MTKSRNSDEQTFHEQMKKIHSLSLEQLKTVNSKGLTEGSHISNSSYRASAAKGERFANLAGMAKFYQGPCTVTSLYHYKSTRFLRWRRVSFVFSDTYSVLFKAVPDFFNRLVKIYCVLYYTALYLYFAHAPTNGVHSAGRKLNKSELAGVNAKVRVRTQACAELAAGVIGDFGLSLY